MRTFILFGALLFPGILLAQNQSNEEGVYVRALAISVLPGDVAKWEAVVANIAKATQTGKLSNEYDWLAYRATPSRYWVVMFSDGFADIDTF